MWIYCLLFGGNFALLKGSHDSLSKRVVFFLFVCFFDKSFSIFVESIDKYVMAESIEGFTGIDKLDLGNSTIIYNFPTAILTVNTQSTAITVALKNVGTEPSTTLFADLKDNFGTANAEAYADYLVSERKFFFDAEPAGLASIEGALSAGEVKIIAELTSIEDLLRSINFYIQSISE